MSDIATNRLNKNETYLMETALIDYRLVLLEENVLLFDQASRVFPTADKYDKHNADRIEDPTAFHLHWPLRHLKVPWKRLL